MVQIEQGVIPRYFQLKEILEKRIQSGEFQPGDKFPTDGTFLNSPQQAPVFFRLANFDEEMKLRGWQPSTKLIKLRSFPASAEVARQLQIPAGESNRNHPPASGRRKTNRIRNTLHEL